MPIVKVMKGRQVSIPKELFEGLDLEVGDYLEVIEEDGRLVYVPKTLVDRDEWYESEEGQAAIAEALEDIEQGRVAGPFESVEELMDELKS